MDDDKVSSILSAIRRARPLDLFLLSFILMPFVFEKWTDVGTDMISDQLLLYSNAQNATACISKTDPDFQYIYTHLKDLPPDFKDDFNRMEFLITENQDFVSQLQQRNFTHDLLQTWMNYHAEIEGLYRNILLEVQRCQNMNNQ
jgi:hypothetical protein